MRLRTTPPLARSAQAFALPVELFDGIVNEEVLHQAVKVFLNNQRQGTASTKTRSDVSGGNKKPWKQKGTGRARQGSTRAPHWRAVASRSARPARLPHGPPAQGPAARPKFGAQRPRPGRRAPRGRSIRPQPKTTAAGLLEKLGLEAEGPDAHGTAQEAVYLSGRNVPTWPCCRSRTPRPTTSCRRRRWWSKGALTGVAEPLSRPEELAWPRAQRGGRP